MHPKVLPFLLLTFGLACAVYGSFDCRRRGQSCQNAGTCPDNSPNCSCMSDWTSYDCSINTTLVDKGSCNTTNCENGGTCIETEVNVTSCACPAEFYGETCSLSRYQVKCESGSLLVGINPYGNFSGFIFVEDNRGTCKFDTAASPAPTVWGGYAKDIGNQDNSCSTIDPVFNPPLVNGTEPADNTTTTYTRVVYVVYEKTFLTSLDEVLTFTCIFDTQKIVLKAGAESSPLDVKEMNQKTTTATLSPVKFQITDDGGVTGPGSKVKLGQNITLTFTVDSTSFDGARLESCVINDTVPNGNSLITVDNSCIQDDAKSIISDPIRYNDDNVSITIAMGIRVFKFVDSDKLGIECRVKACPVQYGDKCSPKSCTNDLGNTEGFGRRRRDAPYPAETTEVGSILVVDFTTPIEDTIAGPTEDKTEPSPTQTCSVAKEVTAILAALGTVTLILLVITIVLVSRAVITSPTSKARAKEEPSETSSNLGQPRTFSRKY